MIISKPSSIKRNRSFKYRLKPTSAQEEQFRQFAGCARFVYNWGLARWNELYQLGHKPTVFGLSNELVLLKKNENHCWLNDCSGQVLQQALANLGTAFQRFFKKESQYPQFKKKGIKDSFRIPQYFEVLEKHLKLPKIGLVKYIKDRPIEGVPKSITISFRAGHWYASVLCEVDAINCYNESGLSIGVDVGIAKLATTYNGFVARIYEHNPNLKPAYEKLKTLQRKMSRKIKGSRNRHKVRLKVTRQHKRISDIRSDTLHKLSTYLCKNHAAIVMEDLKITNMSKSAKGTLAQPGRCVAQKRGLNRSILQQGWGELLSQIAYKSVWYGSMLIIVDAKYTSQTCPCCGFVAKHNRLTQSQFKCLDCEYGNNADIVGAMNIRNKSLAFDFTRVG